MCKRDTPDMVSLVHHPFVRSIREPESGFLTIGAHRSSHSLCRAPAAQSQPCCQPEVAAAIAAYLQEEQTMLTIVLIYMSGFLVVVASVLVAMIKTVAQPNR